MSPCPSGRRPPVPAGRRQAQRLIRLVRPDQDRGGRIGVREPDHVADGQDPGRRQLAGGHRHHHVGRPRRQPVAAERRVEDDQAQQVVGRLGGGGEFRAGLGELRRPATAAQRADGRDVIRGTDRHGQFHVLGGHLVDPRCLDAEKPGRRGPGRHIGEHDGLAFPGVGPGQRHERGGHFRGVVHGHDCQRRRAGRVPGNGIAQVCAQPLASRRRTLARPGSSGRQRRDLRAPTLSRTGTPSTSATSSRRRSRPERWRG